MRTREILIASGMLAAIVVAAPPATAASSGAASHARTPSSARTTPPARTTVAGFALRGYVIGNGGDPSTGSLYGLLGTVGQAVVGMSDGPSHSLCHGFWCFGGSRVISVDDQPPVPRLPQELALGLPAPNPAAGAVEFELALPAAAKVEVSVHDIQGRFVRRTPGEHLDPGWHRLRWDGADESGRPVEAGVYFARLIVNGVLSSQRRIVMRR